MTTVISPKQLRVLKRKQTSPGITESLAKQGRDVTYSGNAVASTDNVVSCASKASANNTYIQRPQPFTKKRIIGRSETGVIKAAVAPTINKLVYCVSNIGLDYSVNDVKKHCLDNGIRVLSCYDITDANRSSRAFIIAISEIDVDKFANSEMWPKRVFLRL